MIDPGDRKHRESGVWSRAAAGFSHTGPDIFQYFGKGLVDFARVQPGAKVLDVATGRGAVLFPAAGQAGIKGQVIGIDYSTGMVDQTNAEIKSSGITNAEARQMDAETLDFPDQSFDYVFCSMAIFFFPRPTMP